jgi:chemotaxis protein methyltransferase CheR
MGTWPNCFADPIQSVSSDVYLLKLRDLVYQIAGIYQPDHKLRFLQDRCHRRMQQLRVTTLRQYLETLTTGSSRAQELTLLLNEVTVGETCFFRNQPQLDALRKTVLPVVLKNKDYFPIRHLRVWSAGCSTGEEAYTLAITLLEETAGLLKGWNFEIVATDLNERSLERARAGTYGEYATRNLPAYIRDKYFRSSNGSLEVSSILKQKVNFSRLNLLDDARMAFLKNIDVIFCCNVLIYFDCASKSRVIQHFYNNLLPNCFLFLGHSESLFGVNDRFRLVQFPGASAYLKPAQQTHVL